MRKADLAKLRRWFADDLRLRTSVTRNPSVAETSLAIQRQKVSTQGRSSTSQVQALRCWRWTWR